MLAKKEKELMKVIYKEAVKTDGKCLLKPADILAAMSYKLDFTGEELEPSLRGLSLDGYFEFVETEKKGVGLYFFELKQKGLAFARELAGEKRQIKFKIALTGIGIAGSLLTILIKVIVDLVKSSAGG